MNNIVNELQHILITNILIFKIYIYFIKNYFNLNNVVYILYKSV